MYDVQQFAVRCRLRLDNLWELLSSATKCHMCLHSVCDYMSSATYALKECKHVTLHVDCCVRHFETSSCATLETQVAHEGSGYVERVRGVELVRTRLDAVSNFNTW